MLQKLHLHHIGPAPTMTFKPKERLNVITGDNGLGKSFLLDLAWWVVTRTWAGTPIRPPGGSSADAKVDVVFAGKVKTAALSVKFDRAAQAWRFPKGQPADPGLVVYARIDGDFAVCDANRRFGEGTDGEAAVPRSLVFPRDTVWNGLTRGGKPACNGLLADWVSWQQRGSWEATALAAALRLLSPSEDEPIVPGKPVRAELDDARLIPTISMPYGQDVPVTIASAGMRRVIAMAYILVWAWSEHRAVSEFAGKTPAERILVIIDEIEAHLHPRWQRVILPAIMQAFGHLIDDGRKDEKRPAVQFIVATHSPLVLASIEPIFSEAVDQLFELELVAGDDGSRAVVLDDPVFRPHGNADAWLTSDAFGLTSSRSKPAEQLLADAAALLSREPVDWPAVKAMEDRLAGMLPELDPFWFRWRAVTQARPGPE